MSVTTTTNERGNAEGIGDTGIKLKISAVL
jgi:hypothetical protein